MSPPTLGGLVARPGQSRGHTRRRAVGRGKALLGAGTPPAPPWWPRCRPRCWAGKAQVATPVLSPVQKTYSSTLRGPPAALENGLARDQESLPRRNSLTVRGRPDAPQQGHSQSSGGSSSPSAEQYFLEWSAKPPDPHGVLLPHLSGAHVKLWKLCYFRWVPEAQIHHGGSITAFHKLSLLADEVDVLGRALRQQRAGPLEACCAGPPPSRLYFQVSGPPDATATPDFLSSSFPFSPIGNLCRRSISGTPLSKFLSGAKIWLSTETLASED